MTKRLIVGCGYLGKRVAENWKHLGHEVHVLTRSEKTADRFRQRGWIPHIGDVTNRDSLMELPRVTEVLYAVGHDKNSSSSPMDVYCHGVKNVVEQLPQTPMRFIHISSTGVYGQADGSSVNETTIAEPRRPGGIAMLAAEQVVCKSHLANHAVSLRLGGIYGSERIPYLEQIKAGQPLSVPADGLLNLVHVEDAANIIERMCLQKPQHPLYLVTDGIPVSRKQYLNKIASLLQAPPVTFTTATTEHPSSQRAVGSKRIDPDRLHSEFHYSWKYPSYREGLAAILGAEPVS